MEERIKVMKRSRFGKWFIEVINYDNSVWGNTQWDVIADFPTFEKAVDFAKSYPNKCRIYNYPVNVVVATN